MTTAETTRDAVFLDWWGLLRRPPVHLELALTRHELMLVGALAGAVISSFVAVLVYLAAEAPGTVSLPWWLTVGGPVGVCVGAILLGAVVPPRVLDGSDLGGWLLWARARGYLGKYDGWVRIVLLVGVIGAAVRLLWASDMGDWLRGFPEHPWLVAAATATASTWVAAMLLARIPELPFVPRGTEVQLPDWLWKELEGGGKDGEKGEEEGEATPEPAKAFSYPFPAPEERLESLGVPVAEEILSAIRAINLQHEGRYFQHDDYRGTLAMVHGDGPEVAGRGIPEMRRLVAQAAKVAIAQKWTAYQFACRLLLFVQRNIRYALDDVSTQRILGQALDEYGRFPLETLVDGEGDCEDTAILAVAMLATAGFPCAFAIVETSPSAMAGSGRHALVGLRLDAKVAPMVDPAQLDPTSCFVHNGHRYIVGETATDSTTPETFGFVSKEWMERWVIEKVVELGVGG